MTTKTATSQHEPAPNGAKLEVTILVDKDRWNELKSQGYSDKDLQKAIEQSITINYRVRGAIISSPILDINSATLLKYY